MNKKSMAAKASIVLSVALASVLLMACVSGAGGTGKPQAPKPTESATGTALSAPSGRTPTGANRPSGSRETAPGGAAGLASDNISTTTVGEYTVKITGGYETNPVDHGRPVILIASALGVSEEVFRTAFSGVTPAGPDRGPSREEAEQNKKALLEVLAPHGITNERLDEVSNYYRYNQSRGELWQHVVAEAKPVIANGKLTGLVLTNAGAGYTSAPTVTVTGPEGTMTATAQIRFTDEFATNGSLASITLEDTK